MNNSRTKTADTPNPSSRLAGIDLVLTATLVDWWWEWKSLSSDATILSVIGTFSPLARELLGTARPILRGSFAASFLDV